MCVWSGYTGSLIKVCVGPNMDILFCGVLQKDNEVMMEEQVEEQSENSV